MALQSHGMLWTTQGQWKPSCMVQLHLPSQLKGIKSHQAAGRFCAAALLAAPVGVREAAGSTSLRNSGQTQQKQQGRFPHCSVIPEPGSVLASDP